ncbi:MAG: winged-helix domain-containing protein [Candidatus Natronoplasma sp.]
MVEDSVTDEIGSEMRLLERTIKILSIIKKKQPIGIKKLSEELGIEEHKVRYSLRLLEREQIIEPTAVGAKLTEKHEKFEKVLLDDLNEMKATLEELIDTVSGR